MKESSGYQLLIIKTVLKTALLSLQRAPAQDCLAVAVGGLSWERIVSWNFSAPGSHLVRLQVCQPEQGSWHLSEVGTVYLWLLPSLL